jgi:DNA-binding NarL/FixJ family response regulator
MRGNEEKLMNAPMRICIAEHHSIFRAGLRSILDEEQDLEIVGEAENGIDALEQCRETRPDLILMEINLPELSGLEAISYIKQASAQTKVLMLTHERQGETVEAAFRAGADGYLLKNANIQEIKGAIQRVLSGKGYLSPGVSIGTAMTMELARDLDPALSLSDSGLTRRELELLKLIAQGYRSKEIAENLNISLKTVKTHRANLMKKLNIHSAARLGAYAVKTGMMEPVELTSPQEVAVSF